MTSRKRDLVPVEREDPYNPNVIEVIYEESRRNEDEEEEGYRRQQHSSFTSLPPQKSRAISRVGDEVDDVLFGGAVPRASSYSRYSSSLPSPMPPPVSYEEEDAYAGTPFDFFDFEAMKRHIQRQVEWMTSDVATLLGGIQMHTNRPMSELLVNGTFFNANARDLNELHVTSGLGPQILGPLVAQLAISMLTQRVLGSTTIPLPQKQEQKEATPLEATPKNTPAYHAFESILDGNDSLAFSVDDKAILLISPKKVAENNPEEPGAVFVVPTTPGARKIFGQTLGSRDTPSIPVEMTVPSPRPTITKSKSMSDLRQNIPKDELLVTIVRGSVKPTTLFPIQSNIGLSFDHESAVHMIQRMRDSVQPIGRTMQKGQDGLTNQLQSIIGQAAQASSTERWLWNQMPANSGITAVAPDVKAAIAEAFENIRALPGKSHIKLIHLIRSPGVRSKFAAYVASLMNVVPGMVAYQSGVSGRGKASYRVSSGYMKEARDARLSRAGLIWFETVGYAQDPNIASASQKISAAAAKLDGALQVANRKIAELIQAEAEVWGAIDDEEVKKHAYIQMLYEKRRREKYEEWTRAKKEAEKDLARKEVERYDRILQLFANQQLDRVVQEKFSRALVPYLWTWLGVFGWATPAGQQRVDVEEPPGSNPGDFKLGDPIGNVKLNAIPSLLQVPRNDARLSAALELAIQETTKAVRDTSLWSNDNWRREGSQALRKVLDLMIEVQSATKNLDVLVKEHLEASQLIAGLTEDDRIVLVKNGDSRSRHRRTPLMAEGSYMPLVATAETMEGYFPRSINLLGRY